MYAVIYWYHDPFYGHEQSGTYFTFDLSDVFAFADFVDRVGGKCFCSI